jgi:hypothetical protein
MSQNFLKPWSGALLKAKIWPKVSFLEGPWACMLGFLAAGEASCQWRRLSQRPRHRNGTKAPP